MSLLFFPGQENKRKRKEKKSIFSSTKKNEEKENEKVSLQTRGIARNGSARIHPFQFPQNLQTREGWLTRRRPSRSRKTKNESVKLFADKNKTLFYIPRIKENVFTLQQSFNDANRACKKIRQVSCYLTRSKSDHEKIQIRCSSLFFILIKCLCRRYLIYWRYLNCRTKKILICQNKAACLIERAFRCSRARSRLTVAKQIKDFREKENHRRKTEYLTKISTAAKTIQSFFRVMSARLHIKQILQEKRKLERIIMIQMFWRCISARIKKSVLMKNWRSRVAAAIKIQSSFRGYQQKRWAKHLRHILVFERKRLSKNEKIKERQILRLHLGSALRLQTWTRRVLYASLLLRIASYFEKERRIEAVRSCQRIWRFSVARRRARMQYSLSLRKDMAAIVLQKKWRVISSQLEFDKLIFEKKKQRLIRILVKEAILNEHIDIQVLHTLCISHSNLF